MADNYISGYGFEASHHSRDGDSDNLPNFHENGRRRALGISGGIRQRLRLNLPVGRHFFRLSRQVVYEEDDNDGGSDANDTLEEQAEDEIDEADELRMQIASPPPPPSSPPPFQHIYHSQAERRANANAPGQNRVNGPILMGGFGPDSICHFSRGVMEIPGLTLRSPGGIRPIQVPIFTEPMFTRELPGIDEDYDAEYEEPISPRHMFTPHDLPDISEDDEDDDAVINNRRRSSQHAGRDGRFSGSWGRGGMTRAESNRSENPGGPSSHGESSTHARDNREELEELEAVARAGWSSEFARLERNATSIFRNATFDAGSIIEEVHVSPVDLHHGHDEPRSQTQNEVEEPDDIADLVVGSATEGH
ncbi:hypothetical protein G7Y89_g8858 [Cudoniella acicularis]|uniref:Uncharacterized protein n=1 Tax=Cudoniella acicularis TaxID=354080 RepID=A0A8H4W362_9HELO|nr:hypothetical protein G7Y89_g8858 [Cudoniella acicularis]